MRNELIVVDTTDTNGDKLFVRKSTGTTSALVFSIVANYQNFTESAGLVLKKDAINALNEYLTRWLKEEKDKEEGNKREEIQMLEKEEALLLDRQSDTRVKLMAIKSRLQELYK